ncbi:MAG: hypothetical protein M1836_006105 [Candelina mexicana]|nr:MAG: hypothetical protein M1836_006105 [Candelina mexicana]
MPYNGGHSRGTICCTVCGLCPNHHDPDRECRFGDMDIVKSDRCTNYYYRLWGDQATEDQYRHDIRVFEEWERKDRRRREVDWRAFVREVGDVRLGQRDDGVSVLEQGRAERSNHAREVAPDDDVDQRSWYEVLGVAKDATGEEILQAYRDRAEILDPEHNINGSEAEKKAYAVEWRKINDAKEQLMHPVKVSVWIRGMNRGDGICANRLDVEGKE